MCARNHRHRMYKGFCTYPEYILTRDKPKILPYYFPFRALTLQDGPNVLVAGKSLAQTFLANGATRLHPEEWTTGTAAGAAASLMVNSGWDNTATVMTHIDVLQALLSSEAVDLPQRWTI
jgi:hypothetical protein